MLGDMLVPVSGINQSIKKLKRWMKPKNKHIGILFQPAKGQVVPQPKGVVGIMAPWNYPLMLSVGPLTAALAAGNRAMIKMSEFTPHTNALLALLISQDFQSDKVAVVGGEVEIASAFSNLPFDHLFFTGSTHVGKLVLQAAAKNLVPVTLELGGKSPAIIDRDMNIRTAVSRFMLGKTVNSGQTCVAPDYIFCPRSKMDELVAELKNLYSSMYPSVTDNRDCTSIITDRQYSRLNSLLDEAKSKGASVQILSDDQGNDAERKMPLTIVTGVNDDMRLMQEEIFGPIFPILPYDDMNEVVEYINARPRPLALYLYSFNKDLQQHIIKRTHAGSIAFNDAAFQVANEDLPFGGVGESGMGSYHSEDGFRTFSHYKSILTRGRISLAFLLFPPFGKALHKLIYKLFIR